MTQLVKRVSVIGLGKLGSPIAACLAARGFDVVGVDSDPAKVDAINGLQPPVFEPGLFEMLQRSKPRLRATHDIAAAIDATDLTLIIVPTPSDAGGGFSLRFLLPVLRAIGQALRTKTNYHTVVITSTVMPGATGGEIREALELTSGKKCGAAWGLCYSPEFVALGSVIQDFLHPDFVLIGQSDARAGDALESVCRRLYDHNPPVARMTFVNAELAKLAVNTYVTTKITFANMLAGICERLPGGDIDAVTRALGLDSRIGRKYLRGAVGYGGPCFPRDNAAMAALARNLNTSALLAESVDQANREQVQRLAALVKAESPRGGTVAVLGLAYKPNTDVIEQSQGVMLASALADEGVPVIAHDPAAMEHARLALGGRVELAASARAAVDVADVVVIVTPWDEYKRINAEALRRGGERRVVIDCWRCLDRAKIEAAARYVAVGVGPEASAAAESLRVA